ncbi:MAG: hypothetical protein Ct9H300mP13_6910 [Gammaproteobacteria bacterium]|nr:MAG: hypothetical protein Ct9H300mP13_6910 [Gammaproteobacteria bacterium]
MKPRWKFVVKHGGFVMNGLGISIRVWPLAAQLNGGSGAHQTIRYRRPLSRVQRNLERSETRMRAQIAKLPTANISMRIISRPSGLHLNTDSNLSYCRYD